MIVREMQLTMRLNGLELNEVGIVDKIRQASSGLDELH